MKKLNFWHFYKLECKELINTLKWSTANPFTWISLIFLFILFIPLNSIRSYFKYLDKFVEEL